jgi:nucleotide-binding universal stress UspA family protein
MYQRILVPVDGSELSERAINESIQIARQLGASITGFVAAPMLDAPDRPTSASAALRDAEEYDAITAANAERLLTHFAELAQAAGVPFTGHHAQVPRIDKAIIAEAESRGCDLIVMVTHGRGAFGEFLYGSQTKAVLSGSKLPLLVLH